MNLKDRLRTIILSGEDYCHIDMMFIRSFLGMIFVDKTSLLHEETIHNPYKFIHDHTFSKESILKNFFFVFT